MVLFSIDKSVLKNYQDVDDSIRAKIEELTGEELVDDATAVGYLVIIGFSEAFMCVELTTVGALSGLGRTRLCSIISIAFTSARIPLAIILGGLIGLSGIWWALSITSIIKGIIFTCTFLWITRKRG